MFQHNNAEALFEICQEILDYLRKNPKSQDSLQGICQWWLGGTEKVVDSDLVEKALTKLVQGNHLKARHLKDGTIVYSLKANGS